MIKPQPHFYGKPQPSIKCKTVVMDEPNDPYASERARRFLDWMDRRGGAAKMLRSAGIDPYGEDGNALRAWCSELKRTKALGAVGALKWETRLAGDGMPPGYLTDGLTQREDATPWRSDTGEQAVAAPVYSLDDISTLQAIPSTVVIEAPYDLPPHVISGHDVTVQVAPAQRSVNLAGLEDGQVVLARTLSGGFVLGVFRRLASGPGEDVYEIDCGRLGVFDSARHKPVVLGIGTEVTKLLVKSVRKLFN